MAGPNHEVFALERPETRKQLYSVFWDSEYLDLPIVEKRNQKRPAFDSETVTRLVSSAPWYVQFRGRLRAGELVKLGLEIDKHFADNVSTVLVRQKVRKRKTENYLKTDNAFRDIDLNASVVKMLKEFIGLRTSGFVRLSEWKAALGLQHLKPPPPSLRSRNWVGVTRKLAMELREITPSADSATRTCERIGFRMT